MKVFFEEFGSVIIASIIGTILVTLMVGIFSSEVLQDSIMQSTNTEPYTISETDADRLMKSATDTNGVRVKIETKTGTIAREDVASLQSSDWVVDELIKKVTVSGTEIPKDTLKQYAKTGRFSYKWSELNASSVKIVMRFVDEIENGRTGKTCVGYTVRSTALVKIVNSKSTIGSFKINDDTYAMVPTTWKSWLKHSTGGKNYILDDDDYVKNAEGDMIIVSDSTRKPVKPGDYIKDGGVYIMLPEADVLSGN